LAEQGLAVYNRVMVRSLRHSLADYPLVLLKAIAEGWRLSLTDEQTAEIVSLLVLEMSDRGAVARVVGALGETERLALGYVAAGAPVKAHIFQRKFGTVRGIGPGRLEWDEAWKHPASPAESLWYLGLIQREVSRIGAYHGDVFYVPAEIQAVLPSLPAELPSFRLELVAPPTVTEDDGDALARDAFLLLSYLRRHEIRTKKEGWSRRAFSELRTRLSGSATAERLGLLERACVRAGLVAVTDGLWRPEVRAASWLKKSPEARQRQLFDAWRTDPLWNELGQLPGLRCEKTGWRNDPRLARDAVVKHLRDCPADTWSTIASFVDSVREVDPDFQRPDGDYDSWYIKETRTGSYLSGFVHWDEVEGALLRYLLTRPLLWLGLVTLGRGASDDEPGRFRLTTLGTAVLRLPAAESSPGGAGAVKPIRQLFVLRPDSSIVVPAAAEWYDRWLLGRFATWVGSRQGAALYRFDAGALRASLQEGVTLPQILAFLKRVSGGRVPAQIAESLRSLAEVRI
jgi:hypothetical protein